MEKNLLDYMDRKCHGVKNAESLVYMQIYTGLELNVLITTLDKLYKSGHIAYLPEKGYWFIPLYTKDINEIQWLRRHYLFMQQEGLKLLSKSSKWLASNDVFLTNWAEEQDKGLEDDIEKAHKI